MRDNHAKCVTLDRSDIALYNFYSFITYTFTIYIILVYRLRVLIKIIFLLHKHMLLKSCEGPFTRAIFAAISVAIFSFWRM